MARRGRAKVTASEATLWAGQQAIAGSALAFAIQFLGCRSQGSVLDAAARTRLLTILRAVSWVESKHGTAGANQPSRDPAQCGNPADSWWKELTGQSGNGNRFIRGPGLSNLWANEVAAEAEKTSGFPSAAAMGKLGNKKKGHDDPGFAPAHSYVWGTIFLIHLINTTAGDKSFDCGDLARDRLIDGAVAYNGGGDAAYRSKIIAALKEIGDLKEARELKEIRELTAQITALPQQDEHVAASALLAQLITASHTGRQCGPVARTSIMFDPGTGRIVQVDVEFHPPS
jgi:hypothetical protein